MNHAMNSALNVAAAINAHMNSGLPAPDVKLVRYMLKQNASLEEAVHCFSSYLWEDDSDEQALMDEAHSWLMDPADTIMQAKAQFPDLDWNNPAIANR
jgi:hypothetical protein